jgi:hypothetical protein
MKLVKAKVLSCLYTKYLSVAEVLSCLYTKYFSVAIEGGAWTVLRGSLATCTVYLKETDTL